MKVSIVLLLSLVGCGAYARPPLPPALTRNLELESLEQAVRWPDPTVGVVMQLVSQYLSVHREEEGYRYFEERARAVPQRPLFGALTGLFQARMAKRVPLLKRVRWVEEAIARLDRAAAQDGFSRYLRGIVFADLPARFGKAQQAVDDLTWMLASARSFPPGLRRGAERGLASARATLAGQPPASAEGAILSDYSVSATSGFRFGPPEVVEPAPGIFVVRGYDFADLAFVATDDGLVAIDAGTTRETAAAALAALRKRTDAPIRHVIVTHAHWDHIGGLDAILQPGTEVIAQAGFAEELARVNAQDAPFSYFFGKDAHGPYQLAPTRLIARPETLTIGRTRIALYPASGGETPDALLVHLPDAGVLFVGDVFMPYLGAPFAPEGSPEGLFETIDRVQALAPRLLLHGHAPLTEYYTIEAIAPLGEALRIVHREVLADLREGKVLPELLARNRLPAELAAHPGAVMPFLLMRDNLIKRDFVRSTGYWKADGEGLEVLSRRDWAAALDLLAQGRDGAIAEAAETLNERGDFALALRVAELAQAAHPGSEPLRSARTRALKGLRARSQFNPFKFIIYSNMLGQELAPVPKG